MVRLFPFLSFPFLLQLEPNPIKFLQIAAHLLRFFFLRLQVLRDIFSFFYFFFIACGSTVPTLTAVQDIITRRDGSLRVILLNAPI